MLLSCKQFTPPNQPRLPRHKYKCSFAAYQYLLSLHAVVNAVVNAACLQEGDGISPTAIREILLLRELDHEHIVKLTAVHINRCVHQSNDVACYGIVDALLLRAAAAVMHVDLFLRQLLICSGVFSMHSSTGV
jgi:hypothetical protein